MSLNNKLAALKKEAVNRIPPDALVLMQKATENLKQSDIMNGVLKKGDHIPDINLPSIEGEIIHSSMLLDKGPLVICFYRGVW